jgi:hypothetical protein
MLQIPTAKTNPEVDRIVEKMSRWLAATPPEAQKPFPLTRDEVQWLLAEIEGGREAFGTIVESNTGLRSRVATMQGTINTLMSMRN